MCIEFVWGQIVYYFSYIPNIHKTNTNQPGETTCNVSETNPVDISKLRIIIFAINMYQILALVEKKSLIFLLKFLIPKKKIPYIFQSQEVSPLC